MGFDLKGAPALIAAMERCADVLTLMSGSAQAQSTIKKGLDKVAVAARGNVHSVTGNLRKGIQARVKITAESADVGEVGVSYKRNKRAHHAHLVEYGHANFNQHGGPYGKTPPHAFFAPAVAAHAEECINALENAASEAMQRGWGG